MKEELSETMSSEPGMGSRHIGLLAAILLLPAFWPCGTALAQSGDQQKSYEIYMTAARKLYAANLYRDAVEQFEKAYAAFPDPKIYFNLAQSHRMLGEDEKALEYYRKFLAAIPTIAEFSNAQKKDFTREIQKKIGELEAGRKPGVTAPAADGKVQQEASLQAAPEETPGLTSRWWFWTGSGVTALLAAGTVWAGLRTVSYNDEWEKSRLVEDRDRAVKYQNMTDLLLMGSLAGAVAVAVSSVIWKRQASGRVKGTASRVSLMPGPGARSWLMTLSWEF